ncbi:MAG: hypothetical protein C0592_00020, partial [Marinilabiliales bacterium]
MDYAANGNITNKQVEATRTATLGNLDYDNSYTYGGSQPHAVTQAGDMNYGWDDNGNMVLRYDDDQIRYMCWDEENRLVAVRDSADNEEIPSQLSVYLYNAGGERVWKMTGQEVTMQLSGRTTYQLVNFEKTLYISPLMVMGEEDYTKHYFIEGERVTSKIGSGFGMASYIPEDSVLDFITTDNIEDISDALDGMVEDHIDCTNYDEQWDIGRSLAPAADTGTVAETDLYFYHPDHLGSSAFITNASGNVCEHLQYLP